MPLLKKVKSYNPKADLDELVAAYRFAEASHEGQKRKSGEDFVEHPLSVAGILADLRLDTTTLEAALLHDTVEDTDGHPRGDRGASSATRSPASSTGSRSSTASSSARREQQQAENVRKMIVAMAGDIRVLLIKLADRLHNMRTLSALPAPQAALDRHRDPRDLRAAREPPRVSRRSSGSWRTCRSSTCTRGRIERSRAWWTPGATSARP